MHVCGAEETLGGAKETMHVCGAEDTLSRAEDTLILN